MVKFRNYAVGKDLRSIKFFDIVVILIILITTVYFMKPNNSTRKSAFLIIENKRYPLNLEQQMIIDLKKYGKNMKLEIKDKKVRFIESDCNDKICISMGYVKNCGDSAICVPNKTAIIIECDEPLYDGISR